MSVRMPDNVHDGYQQAIAVLRENISDIGFSASPERVENYYSVWSRDHAICVLAAVLSKDKELIDTAKKGILKLLQSQRDHGQVPSYIEIEKRKSIFGGLGSIASVDSNMWVIIAAAVLYRETRDKRFLSHINLVRYRRLFRLLKGFDVNECGLIEVPKAGDWADIFNRSYHVLYDECLYYLSLKALGYLLTKGSDQCDDDVLRGKIRKDLRKIKKSRVLLKSRINSVFWFTKENIDAIFQEYMIVDQIENEDYQYYQSHVMPFKIEWSHRFDSFGNIMAMLSGVADKEKKKTIIRYALKNEVNQPMPIAALRPPVYKRNKDWESIYRHREMPHTYHNGGIWPMISGFWILALVRSGFKSQAKKDLLSFAEILEKDNWRFHEYYHGKTAKPLGKTKQAWSAAGYILAYNSVVEEQTSIISF